MFDKILRYSVYNPGAAFGLALLLLGGAFYSYQVIPIDAVPDITNVQVQVMTRAESLDGETIEANITYPIESAMGAVPNVQEIRSVTRFGLSVVTVIFEEGTDIYLARQLVGEQLATLDLQDAQPRLGPIATGLGEIYHYSIEVKEPATDPKKRLEQLMRLRTIQEWEVKRRLLAVQGVAEVNTIGGYEEIYFVQPDPVKMSRYGIHFDDLKLALQRSNRIAGGGYIQQTANQLILQGDGLIRNPEEIESLPLKQLPDLTTLRVGDVASVDKDKEIRTGAAVVNGQERVLGTVFMLLGENSRTVSSRVDERVNEIRKTLPEDVEIKTLYNRSYLVDGTIETVQENLVFGALLVVVVLLLLTGNFRAAIIASAVIPLSMAATLISMYVTGVSANLMSLGALDFGIIIDGAVIVIDQCVHSVQSRASTEGRTLSRSEIKSAVAEASIQIRRAAGFGQIIILVVFLPIFALTGIEGKMFRPMAAAFCFALFAAFILAFTVVPALAGTFLRGHAPREGMSLFGFLDRGYSYLLSRALQKRTLIVGLSLLLLVLGGWVGKSLGGEFIPTLYERAIAMQFVRPPSISVDSSVKLERLSHKVIQSFPEVDQVFTRIGAAEIATDPMGVNIGDSYIMLKPRQKWPEVDGEVRTPNQLRDALRSAVQKAVPGQRILMSQPIQLRFNELLEGSRSDLTLKIYGDDLEKLQHLSEKAAALLSSVPGSGNPESEIRGQIPIIKVEPRTEVLQRLGLSRKEILDTVQMGLGGHDTGFLYRGVRRFPIRIRLKEEDRSLSGLSELPVGVTDSSTEPLDKLARIYETRTFEMIKRDSMQRRGAILINPTGGDTAGFVEVANRALKDLELPPGYYTEWGGSFENLQKARSRLLIVAPLAFLIVSLMIYSAFRSWIRTLMVLAGVPFALVGGVLALAISGQSLSISASVGFIALFGISVLNGVVLMSRYRDLSQEGIEGEELALQGARSRLRAVAMTALTDIFGFMPMMLATGLGAEVQRPLATVVVGGVLTSSFVILFFFPVIHTFLEGVLNRGEAGKIQGDDFQ